MTVYSYHWSYTYSNSKGEKMAENKKHELEQAIEMAQIAHSGQLDKSGRPYILHPLRVMLALGEKTRKQLLEASNAKDCSGACSICDNLAENSRNSLMIVGALHDALEDSEGVTLGVAYRVFGEAVKAALEAISRREGEEYFKYIERCSANKFAKAVKIEDLRDNLRPDRQTPETAGLARRYEKALAMLMAEAAFTITGKEPSTSASQNVPAAPNFRPGDNVLVAAPIDGELKWPASMVVGIAGVVCDTDCAHLRKFGRLDVRFPGFTVGHCGGPLYSSGGERDHLYIEAKSLQLAAVDASSPDQTPEPGFKKGDHVEVSGRRSARFGGFHNPVFGKKGIVCSAMQYPSRLVDVYFTDFDGGHPCTLYTGGSPNSHFYVPMDCLSLIKEEPSPVEEKPAQIQAPVFKAGDRVRVFDTAINSKRGMTGVVIGPGYTDGLTGKDASLEVLFPLLTSGHSGNSMQKETRNRWFLRASQLEKA